MAGFEGIFWAPGQLAWSLRDRACQLLPAHAPTYAVSKSIHYGLFLVFEGIRFFVKQDAGELEVVFVNLDRNIARFRAGIRFNLPAEQAELVPTGDELLSMCLWYLRHPQLRAFLTEMAQTGAQGYLRPFTIDDAQSIGVTFPTHPVVRMVAARYRAYLGEPFTGVVIPSLVRATRHNGTGCLKLGGNYLISVKAVDRARRIVGGAGSALFLDDRPYAPLLEREVTEWDSSCCLFALRDGTVIKIPESPLILPSVTIAGLCGILRQGGADVVERHVAYGELVEWADKGEVVTVCSVGTAGILNRCASLALVDDRHEPMGRAESDVDDPLYRALGEARTTYWDVYRGLADPPPEMVVQAHPLGQAS